MTYVEEILKLRALSHTVLALLQILNRPINTCTCNFDLLFVSIKTVMTHKAFLIKPGAEDKIEQKMTYNVCRCLHISPLLNC